MMPPVRSLTLVYDSDCGLCTRVKDWIGQQATLVKVELTASGSGNALSRFPQIPASELAVVANTGEVWLGNRAWIVCLWALRDYRNLAFRLTSPLLMMMAREAFVLVSSNRSAISGLLGLRSDQEMEQQLRKVAAPGCETPSGSPTPWPMP
jgi:predicted DCC family thiol-disulfide oxidoreductase YuxK